MKCCFMTKVLYWQICVIFIKGFHYAAVKFGSIHCDALQESQFVRTKLLTFSQNSPDRYVWCSCWFSTKISTYCKQWLAHSQHCSVTKQSSCTVSVIDANTVSKWAIPPANWTSTRWMRSLFPMQFTLNICHRFDWNGRTQNSLNLRRHFQN
jgi:hypothetical protein